MDLKSFIRDIPDFPTPGVLFRDISPLLASPEAFDLALEKFMALCDPTSIDLIAGIESRGFILGAALAAKINKGFVAIRKAGKLPPPVEKRAYSLEYGQAAIEMKRGEGSLLIIDDVLATGGTLQAAIDLSTHAGYQVSGAAVLINLTFLNQMKFNHQPIPAVLHY